MFQNTLLRLRSRSGTDGRFLYWWSRHAYGSGLYSEAAQGLGIWHLSSERLRALPFPVLPEEEQRRIADFLHDQVALLDRAASLREQQLHLIAEVSELRIEELVLGRSTAAAHVPAAYLPLGQVPAHWGQGRLRSVR